MRRAATLAAGIALSLATAGCSSGDESGWLVVGTPWPLAARAEVERRFEVNGATRAIRWVELGPHRWGDACDRRGGVDVILGGAPHQLLDLLDAGRLDPVDSADPAPWRLVDRPGVGVESAPPGHPDPRDDPATLGEAQAVLAAGDWAEGYAALMRRPVEALHPGRAQVPRPAPARREVVALVRGGRHRAEAHALLAALARPLLITAAPPDAELAARADDLLADLLGAALVDARNERRDAQLALVDQGRPGYADSALGEAPPWPPASVARLRAEPTQAPLADVLAGQLVGDAEAMDWLEHSWRGPARRVDGPLLRDLAGALDGRLAREPRFRAWLRGEWTAWTQQLDRRVARLAGGYRPR